MIVFESFVNSFFERKITTQNNHFIGYSHPVFKLESIPTPMKTIEVDVKKNKYIDLKLMW